MRIILYGAGGFGAEVAWLIEECQAEAAPMSIGGFVDDAAADGQMINGYPVVSPDELSRLGDCSDFCVTSGNPAIRKRLVQRMLEKSSLTPASIIHPSVRMSRHVRLGSGVVVCAGSVLTTNIVVGDYVQINLNCTIGHNVTLAEYVTLAPGVHVSGWVELGPEVYAGTGATFVNGRATKPLKVGRGAVIGAGACVTRDVAEGETVVGVPARPIRRLGK